ncbi:EthD family reductase [Alkalihalobacterium elongatum]|uniref:EthD family reductase n=1 Tax=Alkalihalobacterium elongatum TaxID=2675466 RepID=UPI001C1F8025|nr:EthD family reductase [Alkalihalobacterium elongatum]
MAKLLVVYDQPTNKEGFDAHYFGTHIPLAEKLPNVKSVQANRVLGVQNSDLNPYLVVQIEFDNMEELNQNMGSPQGKELTADGKNLMEFISKPPTIMIVD